MLGNWHVPCGVGEKLEITSNAYLLLTLVKKDHHFDDRMGYFFMVIFIILF